MEYEMDICVKYDLFVEEPYWKKYYECSDLAIKSMRFTTEFGCEQGIESTDTFEPSVTVMGLCELNIWNLLGAPYKSESATLCSASDTSAFC